MAVWPQSKKEAFREAHTPIMPEKQWNHNYPHADVKGYFDAIFTADCPECKGMVSIAIKRGDSFSLVASVPAGRIGEWAKEMHVSTRHNYYYGKAQYAGTGTWGTENTFSHNAIYVDIDDHSSGKTVSGQTLIDTLCYAFSNEDIPTPNIIEASGRGYHLVWLIGQVPASLGWMVEAVSRHFAQATQELLVELHAQGYSVDMGYSSNISGLTRIPGTYNTAAKAYSTFQMVHAIRMDLPKMYNTISAHTQPRQSHRGVSSNTEAVGQQRVDALLRLADIRPIQAGYRDYFFLHLFSAAQMAGMSNQAALELCKATSASFVEPLSSHKIERYLSTAAKKHYKFKTQRIIDDLGITSAEQDAIGLKAKDTKRDTNRARKSRTATRKRNRDREIMQLHLLGFSITAIAAKVRHAYNTVRKVIKTHESNLSRLFTDKELRHIFQQQIHAAVAAVQAAHQKSKRNILCLYGASDGSLYPVMSSHASADADGLLTSGIADAPPEPTPQSLPHPIPCIPIIRKGTPFRTVCDAPFFRPKTLGFSFWTYSKTQRHLWTHLRRLTAWIVAHITTPESAARSRTSTAKSPHLKHSAHQSGKSSPTRKAAKI